MADVDMIPRSYRAALHSRRAAACYAAALAVLLAAAAGSGAALRWRMAVEAPEVERLRALARRADALRTEAAAAQQRHDLLAEKARALADLRGAGAARALAGALDATMNDRVWLERLGFARGAEPAGAAPARGNAPAPAAAGQAQWRIASRVEIAGRALDHGALADFLDRLSASPALAEVRFVGSSRSTGADGGALSFTADSLLRLPEERR